MAARLARALLLPIVVAGLIPCTLAAWDHAPARWPPPPAVAVLSLALAAAGLYLLAATNLLFARQGDGTLTPWDPPKRLVVRGVYRHVRNPMITGVFLVVLAEALALSSAAVAAWFAIVVAVNAAYIPLSEEPGLERRFGEAYRAYKHAVPRWIPRLASWDGDSP